MDFLLRIFAVKKIFTDWKIKTGKDHGIYKRFFAAH